MAINRYYSAVAQDTTITSGISSSSTTVAVGSVTGLPSVPFVVALDYNNSLEELVTVTNVSGLTLTISRANAGLGSSTVGTPVAHGAGATVRHVITAQDLTETQAHIAATGAVHGITGSAATFLANPTSANLLATVSDETGSGSLVFSTGPTISGPTISSPIITGTINAGGNTGASGTFLSSTGTGIAWATSSGGVPAVNGVLTGPLEAFNIVGTTGPTGGLNVDIKTAGVWYYTANATANFTLNFRGDGSTTLNSILATGQAITVSVLWTNGAGPYSPGPYPYYPTAITIDGTSVTPQWSGKVPIFRGDVSATSSVSYTIIKTASATFTVLATQGVYA